MSTSQIQIKPRTLTKSQLLALEEFQTMQNIIKLHFEWRFTNVFYNKKVQNKKAFKNAKRNKNKDVLHLYT